MTSRYVGSRNKPARQQDVDATLSIIIDKKLACSDKIRMPEHVLNSIMRLYPNNPPNPVLFEIKALVQLSSKKPQLHCGVLEFTAERGHACIPYWMTQCLTDNHDEGVKHGTKMRFKLMRGLQPLKFAKFRPLDKRFARDIQTPRATLEHALRKFTVLTAGQRLPIVYNGRVYTLIVEEVRPSPVGHLIDTNLQVEFVPFDELATDNLAIKTTDRTNNNSNSHLNHNNNSDNNNNHNFNEDEQVMINEDEKNDDDSEFIEVEQIAVYTKITKSIELHRPVYYKIQTANPNFPMCCKFNIISGDGNIYMHTKMEKPSIADFQWCEESCSTEKVIYIPTSDAHFATWFYIGVFAFQSEELIFELTLDQDIQPQREANGDGDEEKSGNHSQNGAGAGAGTQLGSSSDLKAKHTQSTTMTQCAHCKKYIAKQSFMMHEMRCAQINYECAICHKIIAKSMKATHIHCVRHSDSDETERCDALFNNEDEMQRHFLLKHSKIECNLCKEYFYPNNLCAHQKFECLMRSVPCHFCGMNTKYMEAQEHERYCGALTIDCQLCGESVTRKWLENHLASEHELNPTLQTTLVQSIIHSTLGLDQTVTWGDTNGNNGKNENNGNTGMEEDIITGLDEDENARTDNNNAQISAADSVINNDPVVQQLKRQFSEYQTVVATDADAGAGAGADANGGLPFADVDEEDDELDADLLHEFICPFCQKHPPKAEDFGDHLQKCNEKQMRADD